MSNSGNSRNSHWGVNAPQVDSENLAISLQGLPVARWQMRENRGSDVNAEAFRHDVALGF